MKYLFLLAVFFVFWLFPPKLAFVQTQGLTEGTEAGLSGDIANSEFCCDREHTADWAQEMSQQESRDIVAQILPASTPPEKKRRSAPANKGQR